MTATKPKPKRAKQLGISDDDYAILLASQAGYCAICNNTPKRLKNDGTPYRFHVDHDHKTGRIRGLLCYRCNSALRPYMDEKWLLRAARYVREP